MLNFTDVLFSEERTGRSVTTAPKYHWHKLQSYRIFLTFSAYLLGNPELGSTHFLNVNYCHRRETQTLSDLCTSKLICGPETECIFNMQLIDHNKSQNFTHPRGPLLNPDHVSGRGWC